MIILIFFVNYLDIYEGTQYNEEKIIYLRKGYLYENKYPNFRNDPRALDAFLCLHRL